VTQRRRSPLFAAWLAITSRGPVCRRWLAYPNFIAMSARSRASGIC
jgi:hypothetical protein